MDPDREWWLRVPGVLLSPRSVFVAMREESTEDLDARSEPVLLLTSLAGIAVALGSSTARTLYDDPLYDGLVVAVWAVVAGAFIAFTGYFIVGGALYIGVRGLGSAGSFRRARHVLAFSLTPVALSLFVVWPLQIAAFGADVFRRGGSDDGVAATFLDALAVGFALWSVVLLVVGVRAVHGWTWWRSLAALALVALFLAAFSYIF